MTHNEFWHMQKHEESAAEHCAQGFVLTRSEHERLTREWKESQRMTTNPKSFETWLRMKREYERLDL